LLIGWPSAYAFSAPVAIIFASLFWWHIGHAEHPIFARFQVAGRRIRPFQVAGAAAFLGAWGVASALPYVFKNGLHAGAAVGALALTLSSVGWLVGSLLTAGPLRSGNPRMLLIGGFGAQTLLLSLGALGMSASSVGLLMVSAGVGVGGGLGNNASLTLASTIIEPEDMGRTLSALQFLRGVANGCGAGATAALTVTLGAIAGLRVAQLGAAAITALAIAMVASTTRQQ
jgi:hypothetical protein